MDADKISEVGLAMLRPAMSGAEPCWAWATQAIADIDRATEPEAPGQLGGLIGEDVTEHVGGDDDVETVRAPDQGGGGGVDDQLLQLDIGELPGDLADLRRNSPSDSFTTLALWTAVTLWRRSRASSNAACATAEQALAVILRMEKAVSSSDMNSPGPTNMLRWSRTLRCSPGR